MSKTDTEILFEYCREIEPEFDDLDISNKIMFMNKINHTYTYHWYLLRYSLIELLHAIVHIFIKK